MTNRAISGALMRGGSSKGLYILKQDMPSDEIVRDKLLIRAMGSPDPRQIDGLGGADSLTSKAAIVSPSDLAQADVDYLFAQIVIGEDRVSYTQNCGNILAGIGQFAVERGLVKVEPGANQASVRIHMVNSKSLVTSSFPMKDGLPDYEGDAEIAGVPGTAAPVRLDFLDIAGSQCASLLPTGNVIDEIDGIKVSIIDYGMPVVIMKASDFDISGTQTPDELNANETLKAKVEAIRLKAGELMGLGDVSEATVPKMFLVSPPLAGGAINTRCFIPHTCHAAVGVFAAISVAAVCMLKGSITQGIAQTPEGSDLKLDIEHPSGSFPAYLKLDLTTDTPEEMLISGGVIRTARKLFDGTFYVPED